MLGRETLEIREDEATSSGEGDGETLALTREEVDRDASGESPEDASEIEDMLDKGDRSSTPLRGEELCGVSGTLRRHLFLKGKQNAGLESKGLKSGEEVRMTGDIDSGEI